MVEKGVVDEKYLDMVNLTLDEVKLLKVDKNTNIVPLRGYIYDGTAEPGTPYVLLGNANGDGAVDTKDAVLLKKYLAGFEGIEFNHDAADVNVDGKVDSKDAVRLLRHLAGYDLKLGE